MWIHYNISVTLRKPSKVVLTGRPNGIEDGNTGAGRFNKLCWTDSVEKSRVFQPIPIGGFRGGCWGCNPSPIGLIFFYPKIILRHLEGCTPHTSFLGGILKNNISQWVGCFQPLVSHERLKTPHIL